MKKSNNKYNLSAFSKSMSVSFRFLTLFVCTWLVIGELAQIQATAFAASNAYPLLAVVKANNSIADPTASDAQLSKSTTSVSSAVDSQNAVLANAGSTNVAKPSSHTTKLSTRMAVALSGGGDSLAFTVQPSGTNSQGRTLSQQPVVTVQTAGGTTDTSFSGSVTLVLKAGTGTAGAIVTGTLTVNVASGVATFDSVGVPQSGSGYVLTASTASLPSVDSQPFNVTATSSSSNPSLWNKFFFGGFNYCPDLKGCSNGQFATIGDLATTTLSPTLPATWETSWQSLNNDGSYNTPPFYSTNTNNSTVNQLAYAYDGNNNQALFAVVTADGTSPYNNSLWSTIDGVNWTEVFAPTSFQSQFSNTVVSINHIAVTNDGRIIYAVMDCRGGCGSIGSLPGSSNYAPNNGLYISQDGGHTFTEIYANNDSVIWGPLSLGWVAISPLDNNRIWVSNHQNTAAFNWNLYYSTDGGKTFTNVSNSSGNYNYPTVVPIYPDPIKADRVYLSPYYTGAGVVLQVDSDSKTTQTFANYGWGSYERVAIDNNNNNIAWVSNGSLHKTTNGGLSNAGTWTDLPVVVTTSTGITYTMYNITYVAEDQNNVLWVAGQEGTPPNGYPNSVYITPTIASSTDGGLTWTDWTGNQGDVPGLYTFGNPTKIVPQINDVALPGGPNGTFYHTLGTSTCPCQNNGQNSEVNPANGDAVQADQDLSFAAASNSYVNLSLDRVYNSRDNQAGIFGKNWRSTYDMQLLVSNISRVTVVNPDGRQDVYVPNGSGGYIAPSRANAVLTKTSNNYILTTASQVTYTFNLSGILQTINDRNGNVINLSYTNNFLSKVSDNYGRSFTFTPTPTGGKIASVTDNTGRSVSYGYDSSYNYLTVVTDTRGYAVRYGYDSNNRLNQHFDQNGNLVLQNYYDNKGKVISQTTFAGAGNNQSYTMYFDYSSQPGSTIFTDTRGNRTVYNINQGSLQPTGLTDANGNSASVSLNNNDLPTTSTSANGQVVTATYNIFGKPTTVSTTVYVQGTPQTITTSATYNGNNDPLQVTDARGNSTNYHYTPQGNADIITDTFGHATNYAYNSQNQVISTTTFNGKNTQYAYDSFGHTTAMTETYSTIVSGSTAPVVKTYETDYTYTPQGWLYTQSDRYDVSQKPNPLPTTSYQYDPAGHVLTTTNQLGEIATNQYDAIGHLTTTTNTMGQQSVYGYDWLNRVVTTTQILASGNLVSLTAYDQNGNVVSTTDPRGVVTTNQYDKLNRLITTTVPLLEGGVKQTVNQYDAVGNIISTTVLGGANGNNVTAYQYDGLNRVVTTTTGYGVYNYQSVNIYDQNGNVVQTAQSIGDGTKVTNWNDPAQVITSAISYDAQNRPLVSTINAYNPTNQANQVLATNYGYNDITNSSSVTNSYGIVTINQSDPAGHNISTTVIPAVQDLTPLCTNTPCPRIVVSGRLPSKISYNFYDANGLLVRAIDPASNYKDTGYDVLHRAVSTTSYSGANGSGTALTTYTFYTDTSKPTITTLTPIDNSNTNFTRQDSVSDEAGRLIATTTYTGTSTLNLATIPFGVLTTSSTYDGQGNLLTTTDPNGHITNYGYENTGWLRYVTQTVTSQGVSQTLVTRYDYDPAGNQIHTTDANNHVITNTYDALNRLFIAQDALGYAQTTHYDSLGRPTTKLDALGQQTNFTYDNASRTVAEVTSGVGSNPTIATTWLFSPTGNQITMTDQIGSNPVSTTTYTYDGYDRLLHYVDSNYESAHYYYNSDDQRTSMIFGAGANAYNTVNYGYDGLSRPITISNWATATQTLGYNYNGNRLYQMVYPNGLSSIYNYDGANRVTAINYNSSISGSVGQVNYTYDKLGNRVSDSETLSGTVHNGTYSYDELSRLTSDGTLYNGQTITNSYTYDGVGNRLQVTNNYQAATSYQYDSVDRLITNTATSTGNLVSIDRINLTSYVGYPHGDYDDSITGTGLLQFNYVGSGWNHCTTGCPSGSFSSTLSTDVNANDYVTMTINGVNPLRSPGVSTMKLYGYTCPNCGVLAISIDGGSETFVDLYSPTPQSNALLYTLSFYNTHTFKFRVTGMHGNHNTTSINTYNNNDSLLSTNTTGAVTDTVTYAYDARNRLSNWQDSAITSTASFSYDGANSRLGMTYSGVTTKYLQDVSSGLPVALQEINSSSGTSSYLYGLGSTTPLFESLPNNSGSDWFHYDALGSVLMLSSAFNGAINTSYFYDSFGNTTATTGSATANSHEFTGEQLDPTGLYYNRARYYNPTTGRFISRDTFIGQTVDPLSLNRYIYTQDNPADGVDPSGNCDTSRESGCSNDPSTSKLITAQSLAKMETLENTYGISFLGAKSIYQRSSQLLPNSGNDTDTDCTASDADISTCTWDLGSSKLSILLTAINDILEIYSFEFGGVDKFKQHLGSIILNMQTDAEAGPFNHGVDDVWGNTLNMKGFGDGRYNPNGTFFNSSSYANAVAGLAHEFAHIWWNHDNLKIEFDKAVGAECFIEIVGYDLCTANGYPPVIPYSCSIEQPTTKYGGVSSYEDFAETVRQLIFPNYPSEISNRNIPIREHFVMSHGMVNLGRQYPHTNQFSPTVFAP